MELSECSGCSGSAQVGNAADLSRALYKSRLLRVGFGGVFFASALFLSISGLFPGGGLGILILYLSAYLIAGADILAAAVKNIVQGKVFNENFLMSIATLGAIAIGEYPEAVAVMLFYQFGEYFQEKAVYRSRLSITELLEMRPDFARVLKEGKTSIVDPEGVKPGEYVQVFPGERIPFDGTVTAGEAFINNSALTGESIPVRIKESGTVLSGGINTDGMLTIRVDKPFRESTAGKIIDLVRSAASKKAKAEKFITRFARYYTPVVVIVAMLLALVPPLFIRGADFSVWIYRALIFLVISCPCALVVSVPLTFFAGIGAASRAGVLVKGGNYLEAMNNISTIVFDKTGTLTEGSFTVTSIIPEPPFSREELLSLTSAAERVSNHPIAHAIRRADETARADAPPGEDRNRSGKPEYFREHPGRGVTAVIDGKTVTAGNRLFLEEQGIIITDKKMGHEGISGAGSTVYTAVDGTCIGRIIVSDSVKKDSEETIRELRAMGTGRIVMLTGDNRREAEYVGDLLGIDEIEAELLPQDKLTHLERLQAEKEEGTSLAFIGDGLNDAPVLARADIGIAMGGIGSDAAIEAADVVLMTDEPKGLVGGIRIARRTRKIVIQNIVFALGVKAVVMTLGVFGIAGLWEAVFADVGVALIAVLNSMRAAKSG